MAQPASHIARTRAAVARLTDAFEVLIGCLGEYQWLEVTPGTVGAFWKNPDGTDRTDVDITEAEYTAAVQSAAAIRDFINGGGHGEHLYKVKG